MLGKSLIGSIDYKLPEIERMAGTIAIYICADFSMEFWVIYR